MRSQSFSYDHLYRLTNAVGVYGTIDYTYDEVGNRTGRSHGAEHDTYTYDSDANRLQAITGSHPEQFTYNDEGSTVTRTPGTAQITYNYYAGTQRLKTVVKKRHPPDADPARYIYNGAGQRVQSTNSNPILYHYDRNGFLIAETSPTGTPIKSYIWLHGQPLAMIDHQVSPRTGDIDHNSTVGDADLALLTTRRGNVHCTSSTIYYYHNDHLGTPQKMTNSSGAVVWAADYLPFGQANIIIENVVNNLRFAGQYYDQETGLHYNYHRYYDPTLGRYLRADPVGFAEGVDLYTYVASNPINRLDPKGLFGIGGSAYFVGGAEATLSIHNCCEKSDAYEVTVLTVCGGLGIGLGGAFTPGGTVGGVSSRSGCPRTRYYFKHENVLIYHSVNVQADSQGPSAGADVGAYGLYTAWVFCSDTVISKEKVGCCVN
jgi:RHS repeat-associated protein